MHLTGDTIARKLRYDSNTWIIGSLFISIGTVGLIFANSFSLWDQWMSNEYNGTSVGNAIKTEGGARYKPKNSLFWYDLGKEQKTVFNNDSIFTGPNGKAKLVLNNSINAEIPPNSLIVVETQKDTESGNATTRRGLIPFFSDALTSSAPTLNIQQGTAKIKFAKKGSTVGVRIKDEVYQIETQGNSTTLEITNDQNNKDNPLKIVSKAQDSKIKLYRSSSITKGTFEPIELNLKSNEELLINDKGESKKSPAFAEKMTPPTLETVYAPMENLNELSKGSVTLSWKWVKPFNDTQKTHLEMRKIPKTVNGQKVEPKSKIFTIEPYIQKKSINLTPGTYEWRVKPLVPANENLFPNWSSFTIKPLFSPKVISPTQDQRIASENKEMRNVQFHFEGVPPQFQVEVEITRIAKDKKSTKNFFGKDSTALVNLAPGQYSWRARSFNSKELISPWTKPLDFKILSPEMIKKEVEIKILAQNSLNDTQAKRLSDLYQITAGLKWDVTNAKEKLNYQITVFDESKKVIKKLQTSDTKYSWTVKDLSKRLFYYQVQAKQKDQKDLIQSNLAKIEITLAPPFLSYPSDSQRFEEGSKVLVAWGKTALTKSYELQISSDLGFKKILIQKVNTDNLNTFKSIKPGSYFWRVRSIFKQGNGPWSEIRSFTIYN